MNDPENFLDRWSRRKLATEDAAKEPAPVPSSADASEKSLADIEPQTQEDELSAPANPVFDLASLPPLESISAETDIRAFLAPGVPAELTRAALRRAWRADPKIREFVGLAESAWDFNAPDSMLGFGPFEVTDELRRLVAKSLGAIPDPIASGSLAEGMDPPGVGADERCLTESRLPDEPKSLQSEEEPRSAGNMTLPAEDLAASHKTSAISDDTTFPVRRKHGSALPK
jgi:hypothetical protein